MKKLMIAVAAAALVGGAYAETAYTVTASLKTTVGKSGKQTTTYNLGKSEEGKLWYNDEGDIDESKADAPVTNRLSIADLKVAYPKYFDVKKISGSQVPCLTAAAKKDTEWLKKNIVPLAAIYDEKSANKWCETVKVTEEGCYRVAGTEKIKGVFKGDFCCSALTEVLEDGDLDEPVEIALELSQRFGGLTYAAAKKVEIYGEVTDYGFIAGQGSAGKVLSYDDQDDKFTTEDGVSSVSGYFVGKLGAPACEFCCDDDIPAVAFDCDNEEANAALDTAAYGTFSIKYNAKATKALAE